MGNEFKGLRIHQPRVFIEFALDGVDEAEAYLGQNYFEDIVGQSGGNTRYGVKDIRDQSNMFVGIKFWDMKHPDAVTASPTPYAKDTIILGGLMTYCNFQDNGHRTRMIDQSLNKQLALDELAIGIPPTTPGYTMFAEEDGFHLEDRQTHQIYRFVLEETGAGE